MRIEGTKNAWTLGDCSYIINAEDNKPSPTTAQFAVRPGRQAAMNLVRVVKEEATQPFRLENWGNCARLADMKRWRKCLACGYRDFRRGSWRGVYLLKLPTWSRRVKVAVDRGWDLMFPRDLSFLNIDNAQNVTHAYYRAGDFILRQGEAARTFSIIEDGEVETLEMTEQGGEPKVLAVLGKGDFFGEAALMGNAIHDHSVRARTPVRLLRIGRELFTQLAEASQPFRDLLSKAVSRRSGDTWRRLPMAKALLSGEPLETFLDPLQAKLLTKDTTFADAVKALNESPKGQLLIVDEQQHLWGTLDREDLYDMVARVADVAGEARGRAEAQVERAAVWQSTICDRDGFDPVGHPDDA